MGVCLCLLHQHLHPSHLSAADFTLNLTKVPSAVRNTFAFHCSLGRILHDWLPLREYVKKNGREKKSLLSHGFKGSDLVKQNKNLKEKKRKD